MKRMLFSLTGLVLVLFMNACNKYARTASQAEPLFRGDWTLKEVQGQTVPDSLKSRFEFTPGKISGSTGCNRVSAGFVAGKKQSVKFSPEVSTKMACPDMITEGSLFRALERVDSYVVKGDSLQLLRARMAPVARFVAVYLR